MGASIRSRLYLKEDEGQDKDNGDIGADHG